MVWLFIGTAVFSFWFGFLIHALLEGGAVADLVRENFFLRTALTRISKGEKVLIPKGIIEVKDGKRKERKAS